MVVAINFNNIIRCHVKVIKGNIALFISSSDRSYVKILEFFYNTLILKLRNIELL